MMLGDKINAEEAERLGMIYKIFRRRGQFMESAKQMASTIAQMPTKALAYIKHALNHSASNDLETQLSLEDDLPTKSCGNRLILKKVCRLFLKKRNPHI